MKLKSQALPSSNTFQTNRKGRLEALTAISQLQQAMGGTGYMNESTGSRLMRDAKLMEIGAGTSEIRRMLIRRELMGVMK